MRAPRLLRKTQVTRARFFGRFGTAVPSGPPLPTITSLTLAGSTTAATFTQGVANAPVGPMTAVASDGSTPTITVTGNSEGFHPSSGASGTVLLAPAGGLPAGSYTDVTLRAGGGGYANTLTINPTLTASLPTITGLTIAGSTTGATFQASTANAAVGNIVATTSDGSNPTITVTSSQSFHPTSGPSPLALLAPAAGLAVGTYSATIQASGTYANSPQTINPTLTASTLFVQINGFSSSVPAVVSGDSIWVAVRGIPSGLGLNVNVFLVDAPGTTVYQQVTIPNPAPANFDVVLPLYQPGSGQIPITATPAPYHVIIGYQGSGTIQATSPSFTVNPYLTPPFPYQSTNAQVGALPIIYMGLSATPSGNLLYGDSLGKLYVVKGTSVTVAIGSYRSSSGGTTPANVTAQFKIYGQGLPVGGKNLGGQIFAAGGFPSVTFDSTDSTLLPSGDGTYMISVQLIDIGDGVNSPYDFIPSPFSVVIKNVAAQNPVGNWLIPTVSDNGNAHVLSAGVDYVTYRGVAGLPVATQDFPYPGPGQSVVTVPPVWSTSSPYNPATGGNPADARIPNYYGESLINLHIFSEYANMPRFVTTQVGGIGMVPWTSENEGDQSVEGSYPPTASQNFSDGKRNTNTISGNTNMGSMPETGPFSAYAFWIVSLDGRVAAVSLAGEVKTIAGPRADTTLLPLNWLGNSNPEFPNTVFVGTINTAAGFTFDDMGSANDLCWDPRNPNICYVAKPVDHIVVKCDFTATGPYGPSNPLLSIYVGQNGVGGNVNGAAIGHALLNGPYSVCMMKRTDIAGYPQGTMFIADNYNSLIRVVSADGSTVSTLTGFGDGNTAIPPPSQLAMMTTVAGALTVSVTSLIQTGATAAVVLGTVAGFPYNPQAVGWKLKIFVNGGPYGSGPSTDIETSTYGIYTITAFTDSQHFSINMPTVPTSGTITAVLQAADAYSNPNAVPFATAYTALPFVLRMTSTGDIVLGEAWYNIMARRIWLSGANAGKITRIGPVGDLADNQNNPNWGWLDVDDGVGADNVVHTYGACGPVDDIVQFKMDSNPGSAGSAWRRSLDGSYSNGWPGTAGSNFPSEGAAAVGHYPWGFGFHKSQNRMLSIGKGGTGLTSWRPNNSGAPDYTIFDGLAWSTGRFFAPDGWAMGTVPPFPFGMRPSFTALYGQTGWHLFGANVLPTLDQVQVTYPNDYSGPAGTVLSTFIQGGAGGLIPRPEFAINDSGVPGRPLANLVYMMRRQSLPGSYPTPRPNLYTYNNGPGTGVLVTPNGASLNYIRPVVTVTSVTRVSPTSIRVQWTTNVNTLGYIAGGSPHSFAISSHPYSCWSDPEAGFGTTHDVTITGLPNASLTGLSPSHVMVVVIDKDGNPGQSADQVVT